MLVSRTVARLAASLAGGGRLTALGKAVVLVLAAWGLLVVMPDSLRLVHPLGSLGFTADNDGLVNTVDSDGPAARAGVRAGDRIALDRMSCVHDRAECTQLLFVFGGMGGLQYVRPDRTVSLWFRTPERPAPAPPSLHATIVPVPESQGRDAGQHLWWQAALLADELGALAFITCAAALLWRAPCTMTAGFFLYALWFNPGQYFEFYCWLQGHPFAMIAQETLQAVFQGLGYVGFLVLAIAFPNNVVRPRLRWIVDLLPFVFVLLTGLQLASFLNVFGVGTELVTRASYVAGWSVDVAVLCILPVLLLDQPPEERARTRWLLTGCVVGLSAFILADFNEATTMSPWSFTEATDETLYFVNVVTLAAVLYTVVHHRVVNVTFAITRGAERIGLWALVTAFGAYAIHRVDYELGEAFHWGDVAISLALIGVTLTWERFQEAAIEKLDVVFFPRFKRALRELEELAIRLRAITGIAHLERAITATAASELRISSAAVFRRRGSGTYRRFAAIGWPYRALVELREDSPLLERVRACADGHVRLHPDAWAGAGFPSGVALPTVAVPIRAFGALHAVAVYGAHHRGDALNVEEVEALEKLLAGAALAYEAIEAHALRRQLRALARNRPRTS